MWKFKIRYQFTTKVSQHKEIKSYDWNTFAADVPKESSISKSNEFVVFPDSDSSYNSY